jgi:transposase
VVSSTAEQARCPACGQVSTHVHSRYVRLPADLPWHGVAMRLELHVRRYYCRNSACGQQIFTERLPGVVAPYARRTERLEAWFTLVGFALGGEAGARLLRDLGLAASPTTMLNHLRATALPPVPPPRVVSVDAWSFRRGRSFGTILVDLERHRPIDLLPDRNAATLARGLARYPGIEIISRDRAGAYADGARQGAPQAIQVADRWHLQHNLWEVLEGFFLRRKDLLRTAQAPAPAVPRAPGSPGQPSHDQILAATPWLTGRTRRSEAVSQHRQQRALDLYAHILDLAAKRVDIQAIAQQLQVSRKTVYRYLRLRQPPTRKQGPVTHVLPLDAYKPYLLRRWNEGCRNAQQLWRDQFAPGYCQSRTTVGRFIGLLRQETGPRQKFKAVPAAGLYDEHQAPQRPLTARQAARLLLLAEAQRTKGEQARLTRLLGADAEIAATYELVQAFGVMVRERRGAEFDAWIARVQQQGPEELRTFARQLLKDEAAVRAGLTLPWSQGQTEGQVNRLKLLKRRSYGRAKFDLLRVQVLHRPAG